MKCWFFLGWLTYAMCATGADLGHYGTVYPIAEADILEWISHRLEGMQKTGELEQQEKTFQKKITEKILHPTPTELPKATQPRTFFYTPLFKLPRDIVDTQGKRLFKAGTVVNPLDPDLLRRVSPHLTLPVFQEKLLFINATDPNQIAFADQLNQQETALKIILTQGSLDQAAKKLGRIYFDQGGVLVKRFGIHALPALIVREGKRLKITEIVL